MNILIASSEAVPFAKTGGLADVCGALPGELKNLGHEAAVILPAYRCAKQSGRAIESAGIEFEVPIGGKRVVGRLLQSSLPDGATVYLVEQDDYFDRPELYAESGVDYKDNCERFVFFCRAVMEAVGQLPQATDILHCNDWPTGLIPAYLKIEYAAAPRYENIASLLTIHNMAYQGRFWHWDMALTGIDWKYFNWRQMEFYDELNLLKTGLVFADAINTVSPRYAIEIQSPPHGCGLEGVLQQRSDDLTGIINGVNYDEWSPAVDPHLPQKFDAADWRTGKAVCKKQLQAELGLPVAADKPLVGLVGRLAEQKGWTLVVDVMRRRVEDSDIQWAILGTGEPAYHQVLAELAAAFPDKVAAKLEFSNPLAHRIEAGSDMFMMPSRYEPCGLNQLYSLRYGAVPIVRATGGLADTIVDATAENLAAGVANGFSFEDFQPDALAGALQRACDIYQHDADTWRKLVETGMQQDWSWAHSARQYVELYADLSRKKHHGRVRVQGKA